MDIELLKKRKLQLCGESRTVPAFSLRDDLAAVLKLSTDHKPMTHQNILKTKMEAALPHAPRWFEAFGQAILEMYSERNTK